MDTINIIGAGLVGKTIGKLLVKYRQCQIGAVLNTSLTSANQAVDIIGQGSSIGHFIDLPPATITLIGVPDNEISFVCDQLLAAKVLIPGAVVFHCSGILTSAVLKKLNDSGCFIARLHPIKHIHNVLSAVNTFQGTYCALEGDSVAVETIAPLLEGIQAKVIRMRLQKDYKYHTACVFSTTFPQLIVAAASKLYRECGVNPVIATTLSKDLAQDVLSALDKNAQRQDFVEGPVKRKDMEMVKQNFNSIGDHKLECLYQAMIDFALELSNG